jgi:hypothetical protein
MILVGRVPRHLKTILGRRKTQSVFAGQFFQVSTSAIAPNFRKAIFFIIE